MYEGAESSAAHLDERIDGGHSDGAVCVLQQEVPELRRHPVLAACAHTAQISQTRNCVSSACTPAALLKHMANDMQQRSPSE